MTESFKNEVRRLESLLSSGNSRFPRVTGATDADFKLLEKTTGIRLSGEIVDFYQYANGSEGDLIFAVFSDEVIPCQFNSISFGLQMWGAGLPDVDRFYWEIQAAYISYREPNPRDKRIQPNLWMNKRWFPIGDFNGGGTRIYWDGDPTEYGVPGQIIVYQHDPDGIYYVASDFTTFLKLSNDLLEANRKELIDGFSE